MFQLIETIRIENGEIKNLENHNKRFCFTRQKLFGINSSPDLLTLINIPTAYKSKLCKCRIIYSDQIESIEFSEYTIRNILSLNLVECNNIEYSYKYLDRSIFESLKDKSVCEEILIIKNGSVTDTSISNIVFYDGLEWFTPTTFLLNGTKRQWLLKAGRIKTCDIPVNEINRFKCAKLINALIDFDESPVISTSNIR